jgi:hypothetical protein
MKDLAVAARATVLQAISSLQAVIDQANEELRQLARILDATASPAVLAADPDSPVNMLRALTAARAEAASAREALAPFAHAWSKKMEALADLSVPVFTDPVRPERTRTLRLGDLKRANQVYHSLTLSAVLLDRLHAAERLLARAAKGEDVRQQAAARLAASDGVLAEQDDAGVDEP